jgi:hypothetical protein
MKKAASEREIDQARREGFFAGFVGALMIGAAERRFPRRRRRRSR